MRVLRHLLWTLALAAAIGCAEAPVDDHDHAHEPIVLRATAWSDTHEAFVEHAPLVVGRETELRIFLSDLERAAPVEAGEAVLRWTHARGAVVEARLDEAAEPGVWLAPVALPEAGIWILEIAPPGAEALLLSGIRVHEDAHAAQHVDPGEDPEAIELLKAQQWRFGVRSEPVALGSFSPATEIAATAEAPVDRRAVVSTPVAGRLAAPRGRTIAAPGARVAAGDALGAIRAQVTGDGADLGAARTELVRAEAARDLAREELTRARALFEAEAASARRVREAEAALAEADAALVAARRLDGDGAELVLHAPFDGVVVEVALGAGEYAAAGDPVFTVLDPSTLWVRGWIPESALPGLGGAPAARLDVPGGPALELDGDDLVYLSPELDARSRSASIVYEVDNADGRLRVGQSLSLSLRTGLLDFVLTVSDAALVDEQGRPVVFVQTGGETFARRPVVLGEGDGVRHVVRAGLRAGERVVVDGAWAVKLASADDAVPAHGHTH